MELGDAANSTANSTGNSTANSTAPSLDQWLAFQVTITTNTTIVLTCFFLFGLFRKRCGHVYLSRWVFGVSQNMVKPYGNCVTWVKHTLSISNDHIFRHAGLDALAIIMLVELALQLFVLFMVLNNSILLFGFRKLSIVNFCFGDDRLWAHWSLAFLMVLVMMRLIKHHWHEFSTFRRRYMIELRDACTPTRDDPEVSNIPMLAVHGRSVVVDGIPNWINKAEDPDKELYDFFERMFPGQVDSAVVYRDPGAELADLMAERDEIQVRYESALASKRLAKEKGNDEAKYKPPILSVRQLKKKAKAAAAAAQAAAVKAKEVADIVAVKAKTTTTSVMRNVDKADNKEPEAESSNVEVSHNIDTKETSEEDGVNDSMRGTKDSTSSVILHEDQTDDKEPEAEGSNAEAPHRKDTTEASKEDGVKDSMRGTEGSTSSSVILHEDQTEDKEPEAETSNAEAAHHKDTTETSKEDDDIDITGGTKGPQKKPSDMTMCEGIRELELKPIEENLAKFPTSHSDYSVFDEGVGFVVFYSSVGRSMALQMMLTTPWDRSTEDGPVKKRTAPNLKISPAPEPRDLIHENIGIKTFSILGCIKLRKLVLRVASYWLLFFWAIPVTAITALTQLDKLEEYFPFISIITRIEVIRGFLTGFLPTFALVQFMAFLPQIFALMAKTEGKRSWTEVDEAASQKYVTFQIVNVLFVSALAGGIMETFTQISKDTYAIISILSTAIPGQYFFFTSYIMLLAFGVYPLQLVQVMGLLTKKIKMKRATGARSWTAAAQPPLITGGYAKQYGYIMLAIAISMEFATIAPMILPFSVIFFCISSLVLRHHIYYMYDTRQEGMGRIWPWLMFCVCVIMVICLLTLLGIFYSRQSIWQGTLTWPIIGAVAVFYYFESKKHARSFETLSLQEMKKSENTRTKHLDVQVSSRSYMWMVDQSHTVRSPDMNNPEQRRSVSVNMPAAHVFLHPVLLRHKLGPLKLQSASEEELAYRNIQQENSCVVPHQHSLRADTLRLKRKDDVNIFGKTFVFKRRSTRGNATSVLANSFTRKKSAKSPLSSLGEDGVNVEMEDMGEDGQIDSQEGKAEKNLNWKHAIMDIGINFESGSLPPDEYVEEDAALFLFRSRALVWFAALILAVGYIFGIFSFYEDHIRSPSSCINE